MMKRCATSNNAMLPLARVSEVAVITCYACALTEAFLQLQYSDGPPLPKTKLRSYAMENVHVTVTSAVCRLIAWVNTVLAAMMQDLHAHGIQVVYTLDTKCFMAGQSSSPKQIYILCVYFLCSQIFSFFSSYVFPACSLGKQNNEVLLYINMIMWKPDNGSIFFRS